MNPEKTPQNHIEELPEPKGLSAPSFESSHARQVETGQSGGGSPSIVQPSGSQASPVVTTASQQGQNSTSSTDPHVSTPHIADDVDLIEKEWIESAKRIVSQTSGDPHARSEGLGSVKKDYKKKRFNIDNELGKVG